MRRRIKRNLLASLTIIIVILLIISGYYFLFFDESEPILEEEENEKIVDDSISPPYVNQAVFLEIKRIHKKGIENLMRKIGFSWKKQPNFFLKASIDNVEWKSHTTKGWDTGFVGWEVPRFVEDEQEKSFIKITMYEPRKKLFKIWNEAIEGFDITYDFKTGKWYGDDYFNDTDGYGHFNGKNYEIWFEVHQLDADMDGIPYWTENNILNTNPNVDDSKLDPDMDGVSTSWEWKWGYDPFVWDNHSYLDPDSDGLENIEEYKMEKWLADPFHQDIYIEVDFMKKGPGLFTYDHVLWKESQYMVIDKFSNHMITLHIDDGWPTGSNIGGGEYLRFIKEKLDVADGAGAEFYKYHFSEERRGIFRYLVIQNGGIGWVFPADYRYHSDFFTIPNNNKWFRNVMLPGAITARQKRISLAVVFMHELGHSLGLIPTYCEGIDNKTMVGRNDLPPLQSFIESMKSVKYWDNYESCMNYWKFSRYLLDYSDGTHGEHDSDDWSYLNLTFFQNMRPSPYGIEHDYKK